jgi:hypothetical protein
MNPTIPSTGGRAPPSQNTPTLYDGSRSSDAATGSPVLLMVLHSTLLLEPPANLTRFNLLAPPEKGCAALRVQYIAIKNFDFFLREFHSRPISFLKGKKEIWRIHPLTVATAWPFIPTRPLAI